jgi:hypothetical protein
MSVRGGRGGGIRKNARLNTGEVGGGETEKRRGEIRHEEKGMSGWGVEGVTNDG